MLERIVAPKLRSFELDCGYRGLEHNVQPMVTADWPALETLTLHRTNELGWVLEILKGARLGNLKHLFIGGCWDTDSLCAHLGQSPLLGQLATLDLSKGELTHTGAQALSERATAFKHLQRLELDARSLDETMRARVSGLCADVRLHETGGSGRPF